MLPDDLTPTDPFADGPRVDLVAEKIAALCAESPAAAVTIIAAAATGASIGLHAHRGETVDEETERLSDPDNWNEKRTPRGILATMMAGAPDAEGMAQAAGHARILRMLDSLDSLPTLDTAADQARRAKLDFGTPQAADDDADAYDATRLDLDSDESTRDA